MSQKKKQNDAPSSYRRLFIIRRDLQMSSGKLAAQIAHCAEAYWMKLIQSWKIGKAGAASHELPDPNAEPENTVDYAFEGILEGNIYDNYINGASTKTICAAKNLKQLLKAKEKAEEMGLVEGVDFGLIRDLCLTELKPEDADGRTTTGIWFRPLPDEISHEISKRYQLYH